MKKVVNNEELRTKMKEAINLLSDTVKTTLGPKGSNVIIDHSNFSPFITNDGVTIAENIESDDEVINTILEIAREASFKTNEKVGDGTTTTLVLLQGIFNNGLNLILKGKNPIVLKKELDENLNYLITHIKSKSHLPTKEELFAIAKISSGSDEISQVITKAFLKVGGNAINIKESNDLKSKVIYKKGYLIETITPSTYFFKDNEKIVLENSYILLINNYLNDLNEIASILNYIILDNKSLIIIAEDYSEEFVNNILSMFLNESKNIYLFKNPLYGDNKISLLNDLSVITNAKNIDDFSFVNETVLGKVSSVCITREEILFEFKENDKIKKLINVLKEKIEKGIDKEYNIKRLAMFQNGIAEILVGASTITERRERKMRYDDALAALNSSNSGVVPGSGVIFYELAMNMQNLNDVSEVLRESLKAPFNQIMYNAGLNNNEIINEIVTSNFNKVFNISNSCFEKIEKTLVLDPTNVLIYSLINAVSISGMLLTTTSLVVNEYNNNLNKGLSYTEI